MKKPTASNSLDKKLHDAGHTFFILHVERCLSGAAFKMVDAKSEFPRALRKRRRNQPARSFRRFFLSQAVIPGQSLAPTADVGTLEENDAAD
ncbi:MAG: hypothetical protein FJ145_01300 [Deltaproteobacteria bacterium]|nr:hypothetical protein [Deltaproteobacteria bacterium]